MGLKLECPGRLNIIKKWMYECQLSIGHEILQTTNKMLPILIFIYLINPLNAQHGNSYKLKNRIF